MDAQDESLSSNSVGSSGTTASINETQIPTYETETSPSKDEELDNKRNSTANIMDTREEKKAGIDNPGFDDEDDDDKKALAETPKTSKAKNGSSKNGVFLNTPAVIDTSMLSEVNLSQTDVKDGKEMAEAVNLELVNMKPYKGGDKDGVNGIPVKKENGGEGGSGYHDPYDEYFVPVNEHRKYMRGEKLYVTKDKRRTQSKKKCICWTIGFIILAVGILIAILAGTGVILSNEDNMGLNESSRQLGGSDVKAAGFGNVGGGKRPMDVTSSTGSPPLDAVPASPPTTDMTQLYVPRVLEGELVIDNMEFDAKLANHSSEEFKTLAASLEEELKNALFDQSTLKYGSADIYVKVMEFKSGSVVVKYRVGWVFKDGIRNPPSPIEKEVLREKMQTHLARYGGFLDTHHVTTGSVRAENVMNTCQFSNGGCSHECVFDYNNLLNFMCRCPEHLLLEGDGKTCADHEPSAEPTAEPEPSLGEPSAEPEPTSEEPKAEPEPASEEPKAEPEPTSEEPKAEPEPTSEEPKAEPEPTSKEPKAEPEPTSEEPKAEPEPTSEEPKAEPEPFSEEPRAEPEPTSEEPKAESKPTSEEPKAEPEPQTEVPSAEPKPHEKNSSEIIYHEHMNSAPDMHEDHTERHMEHDHMHEGHMHEDHTDRHMDHDHMHEDHMHEDHTDRHMEHGIDEDYNDYAHMPVLPEETDNENTTYKQHVSTSHPETSGDKMIMQPVHVVAEATTMKQEKMTTEEELLLERDFVHPTERVKELDTFFTETPDKKWESKEDPRVEATTNTPVISVNGDVWASIDGGKHKEQEVMKENTTESGEVMEHTERVNINHGAPDVDTRHVVEMKHVGQKDDMKESKNKTKNNYWFDEHLYPETDNDTSLNSLSNDDYSDAGYKTQVDAKNVTSPKKRPRLDNDEMHGKNANEKNTYPSTEKPVEMVVPSIRTVAPLEYNNTEDSLHANDLDHPLPSNVSESSRQFPSEVHFAGDEVMTTQVPEQSVSARGDASSTEVSEEDVERTTLAVDLPPTLASLLNRQLVEDDSDMMAMSTERLEVTTMTEAAKEEDSMVASTRVEEVTKKSEEMLKKDEEVTKTTEEVTKKVDKKKKVPEEVTNRIESSTRTTEEIMKSSEEVTNQPEEVSNKPEEVTKKAEEVLNKPEEVSKKADVEVEESTMNPNWLKSRVTDTAENRLVGDLHAFVTLAENNATSNADDAVTTTEAIMYVTDAEHTFEKLEDNVFGDSLVHGKDTKSKDISVIPLKSDAKKALKKLIKEDVGGDKKAQKHEKNDRLGLAAGFDSNSDPYNMFDEYESLDLNKDTETTTRAQLETTPAEDSTTTPDESLNKLPDVSEEIVKEKKKENDDSKKQFVGKKEEEEPVKEIKDVKEDKKEDGNTNKKFVGKEEVKEDDNIKEIRDKKDEDDSKKKFFEKKEELKKVDDDDDAKKKVTEKQDAKKEEESVRPLADGLEPAIDKDATTSTTTTTPAVAEDNNSITHEEASVATTSTTTPAPVAVMPGLESTFSKCASGQFQCLNGTSRDGSYCVSASTTCDSVNDCTDGSDEAGCTDRGCPGNFQCASGQCLKRHLVCNDIVDCDDASDEQACEKWQCQFDEFQCPSGRCIPVLWQCDGKPDCANHTDEYNCQTSCGNNEYLCPEGWCIPMTWRCNGKPECAAGDDEKLCDCSLEQFKCSTGGCVSKTAVCDGVDQCPDASDEWDCVRITSDTMQLQIRSPSNTWHGVCRDNWTSLWSDSACQNLGYARATFTEYKPDAGQLYALKAGTTAASRSTKLAASLDNATSCEEDAHVEISCQDFTCGSHSLAGGVAARLVGGDGATNGQWPSVALLYHTRQKASCTASIISPKWLLTSYNCLHIRDKELNARNWVVFGGGSMFESNKPETQIKEVRAIVAYPQVAYRSLRYGNDVALVELTAPMAFNQNVGAICLPDRDIEPRQLCVTAGWGYTSPGEINFSQYLHYLPVPTIDLKECNSSKHYPGLIAADEICAGYTDAEKTPCYNDEGAPLMCVNEGGVWELHGVLSYHSNCGRGFHPSIFSSIVAVRSWVEKTVGARIERKTPFDVRR